MARPGRLRDCVVWAIIIGGHALLITVFTSGKRQIQAMSPDTPSPGVLVLLDSEAQVSPSSQAREPEAPALASIPVVLPRLPVPDLNEESSAITLPAELEESTPGSARIDWQAEAERSAHTVAEQNTKHGAKRIGQHPPSPFGPKKKPQEFQWDPEPKKAGFAAGFIPYVRIGQRCVVGLGFFGCSLSKLPQANSHLFDGMKDPDRQRSSVPDVDTSSALDPPPD